MANPSARVVRGNATITKAVIDATPALVGQRFTAGVATETSKLSKTQEYSIAETIDLHLRGGRPPEAVATLFVAHSDKVKSELHFVIPNLDLLTHKIVNPYVDRIDRHRFTAVAELINLKFGFDNPMDRRRIEPLWDHMRINPADKEFLQRVWSRISIAVEKGLVKNRQELTAFLHGKGLKVRFEKDSGGALAQPVIQAPSGSLLRLKGSIYYAPDFGEAAQKFLNRNDPNSVKERMFELERTIQTGLEFRAYWSIGRLFGKKAQKDVPRGKARLALRNLLQQSLCKLRKPELALQIFTPGNLQGWQLAIENGLIKQLESAQGTPQKKQDSGAKEAPGQLAAPTPTEVNFMEPFTPRFPTKKPVSEEEEIPPSNSPPPAHFHHAPMPTKPRIKQKQKTGRKPPPKSEISME